MGAITGKDMRGDCILPFWLEQGIESSLRDTEEDTPVVSFAAMSSAPAQHSIEPSHVVSPVVLAPTEGTSFTTPAIRGGGGGKGPFTDLDKFYADEEDEATDEEDENSEDESDSEVQPGEHEDEEEEEDTGTDNSSSNPRRDA